MSTINIEEFKLPNHICPILKNKDCGLCGPSLNWLGEYYFEYIKNETSVQSTHDELRLKEFNSWKLV